MSPWLRLVKAMKSFAVAWNSILSTVIVCNCFATWGFGTKKSVNEKKEYYNNNDWKKL
jgi:hypothetical protein